MKTKMWRTLFVVAVLTAFLTGCQSGNQTTEETATPGAAQPESGSQAAKSRPPAAKPEPARVTIPAGTTLDVRLAESLDTGTTDAGASFEGTLASPIVANGMEVAPVGSSVTGKVTNAVSSGRLSRPAELSLTLTSLTPRGGREVALSTSTWSMKGKSHKKRNAELIGGGAAAGALIGALTGGKKGAAIGAGVGAGGGTGVAAATGKDEIHLAAETKLSFELTDAVSLTAAR